MAERRRKKDSMIRRILAAAAVSALLAGLVGASSSSAYAKQSTRTQSGVENVLDRGLEIDDRADIASEACDSHPRKCDYFRPGAGSEQTCELWLWGPYLNDGIVKGHASVRCHNRSGSFTFGSGMVVDTGSGGGTDDRTCDWGGGPFPPCPWESKPWGWAMHIWTSLENYEGADFYGLDANVQGATFAHLWHERYI